MPQNEKGWGLHAWISVSDFLALHWVHHICHESPLAVIHWRSVWNWVAAPQKWNNKAFTNLAALQSIYWWCGCTCKSRVQTWLVFALVLLRFGLVELHQDKTRLLTICILMKICWKQAIDAQDFIQNMPGKCRNRQYVCFGLAELHQ